MKSRKQVVVVNMIDVAVRAMVSTATIYCALMNPETVTGAGRNRVEQAAIVLAYLPGSLNRNLKRNESRTILVIVPDICDPFFSEIIRGIEVTAGGQGYVGRVAAV
ncbi:LacI family DNA-binding transcriptional regulator, partial [Leptospira borgpetersenii serovar Ballum]|nr:LacI family DNA-binding transcriptional regulator [Leptospira borgpetersenii serovar Ballum]